MNYDHACVIWTVDDEVTAAASKRKIETSDDGKKADSNLEPS